MHYSQQHGYNPNGGGQWTPLTPGGPYHFLLRAEVNDLCLTCHDGSPFAPDVFEANTNTYVRQGGGLNNLTSAGPYWPADGHTLNSTDVAPGSNPAWNNPDGLECTDCHSAHGGNAGGNSYRNLGGYGTAVGSALAIPYSRGDVDGANNPADSTWVWEQISSGTSAAHYGPGALIFNEPDQTTSSYANFCKGCHTDFHGDIGGPEIGGVGDPAEEFVRHPAAGANIGAVGGGHSRLSTFVGHGNQLQVMSPTGAGPAGNYTATDADLTPSCFTCHKGHGNQNSFGLIFMSGNGTVTEQGDTGPGYDGGSPNYRDMCKQCHGQGS